MMAAPGRTDTRAQPFSPYGSNVEVAALRSTMAALAFAAATTAVTMAQLAAPLSSGSRADKSNSLRRTIVSRTGR